MIFGKRKRVTTNRATRPFWVVAGSGMDVREKFGKSELIELKVKNASCLKGKKMGIRKCFLQGGD